MSQKPSMPGLPPGMPDPEAIFQSWWPIIIALVGGLIYGLRSRNREGGAIGDLATQRQYFRGARCTSELTLDDKVAIVTGGAGGIGRYIAEDFAKRGARVYLACHSEAEETVKELKTKTKNEKVFCIQCDLSSLKSIQSFVDAFKKKEDKLHYLINNAGVMMAPQHTTEDKFEQHLQVNYLGHFFLTHLLFDTLKQSSPARVMNTTAPAYQLGQLDFEDLNFEKKEYVSSAAYAQSKLAVVFFTKEFAKRYPVEDAGVTMNCAIPGVVRTKIHRHMPFRQSAFINLTFSPFIWFLMKHPEDGAQTTIFCCLAEALSSVTGCLYKECKRDKYHENAENDEVQEKLWNETLKMLDIKEFGKAS